MQPVEVSLCCGSRVGIVKLCDQVPRELALQVRRIGGRLLEARLDLTQLVAS